MNTMKIRELPPSLRPRERLKDNGAQSLAHHELLAIILRTGTRQKSALTVAVKVIENFSDLVSLGEATYEELIQIEGIGPAKAIEVLAMIELGERIARAERQRVGRVMSSRDIGQSLVAEMQHLMQEHVVCLYLNTKNDIIKKKTIFVGSLNSSVAHPREIFKEAVRSSAARIILAHNHPSGNPEPSGADIDFTERIYEAGEMMGIELLDHIIIGQNEYLSMKECGIF